MTTNTSLLQQAYKHISSGDYQTAIGILDTLVNVDAVNVEAWEAYMQITRNGKELDDLCDRVLQITEINTVDRESVLDYYYFLKEKNKFCGFGDKMRLDITFEVVDQFSYPLKSKTISENDCEMAAKFEKRLVLFLDKAIVVPYLALMAISFNLLSVNNNLGYWAVLVMTITLLLGNVKRVFSGLKNNRLLPSN